MSAIPWLFFDLKDLNNIQQYFKHMLHLERKLCLLCSFYVNAQSFIACVSIQHSAHNQLSWQLQVNGYPGLKNPAKVYQFYWLSLKSFKFGRFIAFTSVSSLFKAISFIIYFHPSIQSYISKFYKFSILS